MDACSDPTRNLIMPPTPQAFTSGTFRHARSPFLHRSLFICCVSHLLPLFFSLKTHLFAYCSQRNRVWTDEDGSLAPAGHLALHCTAAVLLWQGETQYTDTTRNLTGNALACTGFLFKQALNIWGDQVIKKQTATQFLSSQSRWGDNLLCHCLFVFVYTVCFSPGWQLSDRTVDSTLREDMR